MQIWAQVVQKNSAHINIPVVVNLYVSKKVKFSYTRYRKLGPELIPVYRLLVHRWHFKSSQAVGCRHLPSWRTSPSLNQYQVILLADRRTLVWITCPRLLCSFVLVGIEPTSNALPLSHCATCLSLSEKSSSQSRSANCKMVEILLDHHVEYNDLQVLTSSVQYFSKWNAKFSN